MHTLCAGNVRERVMDTTPAPQELHTRCAVCKTTELDKTMTLIPIGYDKPMVAIVFIHTRCMGGLPLIALKWTVATVSNRPEVAEKQPMLMEYLTEHPTELLEFNRGDE